MTKLYKLSGVSKKYWETWDNEDDTHTIHWGALGTKGKSKVVKSSFLRNALGKVQKEMDRSMLEGFNSISEEEHITLLIEYQVVEMGTENDVDKRNRLIERMDETLGWLGLGHCDGGSIGSGTMEVCNYVVDFDVAKEAIESDLKGTEFEDYLRIFDEDAG